VLSKYLTYQEGIDPRSSWLWIEHATHCATGSLPGTVWCPYKMKNIEAKEVVQSRATKLIPTIKIYIYIYIYMSYQERLKKLDLPTLAYRRARSDMIEVYKILRGRCMTGMFVKSCL